MSNVAYTDKYKQRWNECQPLFVADNFQETEVFRLPEGYSVHSNEYAGKVGNCNLHGSECRLIDSNGNTIAEWRSIDGSFYKIIQHRNGKKYLIFRQDLYGYSVLDISAGKMMQFFPEASLNGTETFIWTEVDYNPVTNTLAVSGCYWACPNSTHLFTFDDPMSGHQKCIDLIECFEGDYDIYDDAEFVKWDNGDLHLTRYVIETKTREETAIKSNEYLAWLAEKGQEL